MNSEKARSILRRTAMEFGSIRNAASEWGISHSGLKGVLGGSRGMGADMAQRIMEADDDLGPDVLLSIRKRVSADV